MSKSALLPNISLTIVILLMFLASPFAVSAEEVEDIPDTEEQVQTVDNGSTKQRTDQSPPPEKPTVAFTEQTEGRPATPAEQAPATSPVSPVLPVASPVITPVTTVVEKQPTEKGEQVLTKGTAAPVNTLKPSEPPSASMWKSFLASLGLHDNRPLIPPTELKSTSLHPGQDYIIGPGDLLGISVWRDDSLTRTVVVLPDGKIQFPLIGELVAGGKSVAQLKQEFVEKLSRYVVDADISVEVKQSNSLFIYIIGRVNGPGRQMLVADTTVLQALAMAGGLNPFAEKDDIKIFRKDKDRTLVYSFRYSQVVSGNYLDDNLLLQRGDVIVVP